MIKLLIFYTGVPVSQRMFLKKDLFNSIPLSMLISVYSSDSLKNSVAANPSRNKVCFEMKTFPPKQHIGNGKQRSSCCVAYPHDIFIIYY